MKNETNTYEVKKINTTPTQNQQEPLTTCEPDVEQPKKTTPFEDWQRLSQEEKDEFKLGV